MKKMKKNIGKKKYLSYININSTIHTMLYYTMHTHYHTHTQAMHKHCHTHIQKYINIDSTSPWGSNTLWLKIRTSYKNHYVYSTDEIFFQDSFVLEIQENLSVSGSSSCIIDRWVHGYCHNNHLSTEGLSNSF